METEAKADTTGGGELRSTETLYLRVQPEVRARVLEAADRYGLSASEYVSAVVMGGDPKPKLGAEVGPLAILGQRAVGALNALPADALEANMALIAVRKAIIETLLEHRADYDARLDHRGADRRWA